MVQGAQVGAGAWVSDPGPPGTACGEHPGRCLLGPPAGHVGSHTTLSRCKHTLDMASRADGAKALEVERAEEFPGSWSWNRCHGIGC